MTKAGRLVKGSDGLYHSHGITAKKGIGTRAEVWHGTAVKTNGGLFRKDLIMNKNKRIVSRKKHNTAKKEKRLEAHGYFAKKGKFGYVKATPSSSSRKHKTRKHKTRKHKTRKSRAKTI